MANIFVISDTHFGHENMLRFKRADGSPLRDFPSVEAMDAHMVERWNATVRPSDHVYHLGDVTMGSPQQCRAILQQLQGKLRLVRGNHDIRGKTRDYLEFFAEVHAVRVLDNILFSHIPVHPACLGRFAANVHGHIHANAAPPAELVASYDGSPSRLVPYVNVSVEAIDYTPVSLEDLKARIAGLVATAPAYLAPAFSTTR